MPNTSTKRRKTTPRRNTPTRREVVFALLDEDPEISTDEALTWLGKRRIDMGDKKKARQRFYSLRTIWRQERSGPSRPKRRSRRDPVLELDAQAELEILRREVTKLKAALAILLG